MKTGIQALNAIDQNDLFTQSLGTTWQHICKPLRATLHNMVEFLWLLHFNYGMGTFN